jgi:hypothetical protein
LAAGEVAGHPLASASCCWSSGVTNVSTANTPTTPIAAPMAIIANRAICSIITGILEAVYLRSLVPISSAYDDEVLLCQDVLYVEI